MARQIETEIVNILTELLQAIAYKRKMPSVWQNVPSERLAGWYTALQHLQSLGALECEIVDMHGRPYNICLLPEEEYMDLRYRYTSFNAKKVRELCDTYNILLSGLPKDSDGIIYNDPKYELTVLQIFSDMSSIHSPYARCDAELSYRRDALELVAGGSTYTITLRAGQVKDIVSIAANSDYIDSRVSKSTIEKTIGHSISSPLTTVLKDSVFTNELADFADIEPQYITIYSKGTVLERVLSMLEHKPNVKLVKSKRIL